LKIIFGTLEKEIVVPIRTVIFTCESETAQTNKNEKYKEKSFHFFSPPIKWFLFYPFFEPFSYKEIAV